MGLVCPDKTGVVSDGPIIRARGGRQIFESPTRWGKGGRANGDRERRGRERWGAGAARSPIVRASPRFFDSRFGLESLAAQVPALPGVADAADLDSPTLLGRGGAGLLAPLVALAMLRLDLHIAPRFQAATRTPRPGREGSPRAVRDTVHPRLRKERRLCQPDPPQRKTNPSRALGFRPSPRSWRWSRATPPRDRRSPDRLLRSGWAKVGCFARGIGPDADREIGGPGKRPFRGGRKGCVSRMAALDRHREFYDVATGGSCARRPRVPAFFMKKPKFRVVISKIMKSATLRRGSYGSGKVSPPLAL